MDISELERSIESEFIKLVENQAIDLDIDKQLINLTAMLSSYKQFNEQEKLKAYQDRLINVLKPKTNYRERMMGY